MTLSVIVTGASGFVGSSLVTQLKSSNKFEVVPVSRSSVDDLYVTVDDYRNTPKGDVLVHLAESPDRFFVNNAKEGYIDESAEVLDSLIAKEYRKIIYCSSSVVYGDSSNVPYTEESPVCFGDKYTKLKLINEEKIINAGGIVVRLTNIIGSGMAKNNVLSDILFQVHVDGPLSIRNGAPVRDFIWKNDVASALEILIIEGETGIFNVGTGIGVSINEMAEMVLNAAGEDRPIKSLATSASFSCNVVDISKMRKLYEWSPKLTLNQFIKLMVSEE